MSRLFALVCFAWLTATPGQGHAQRPSCVIQSGGVCSILSDAPSVEIGVHLGQRDLVLLTSEGWIDEASIRAFLAGVEFGPQLDTPGAEIRIEPIVTDGRLVLRIHNGNLFILPLQIRTTRGIPLAQHLRDTLGISGELSAAVLAELPSLPAEAAVRREPPRTANR
jgi:hypothetical protein